MFGNGKYMSMKEAAAYTGYSLSWFKRLARDGIVPYTKPTGRLYFKVSDLDRFMENTL